MRQHVVKGTALMRHLKTDADFFGIFSENFLVRNDNKTGGIGAGLINSFFQDLQSVNSSGQLACHRRLCPDALLRHLLRGKRIVLHTDLPPRPGV